MKKIDKLVKKSSKEWQEIYPEITVLDPDGWDRTNFEQSWSELITLQEYNNRVAISTCKGKLNTWPLKVIQYE